jgi:predicted transcriptional regulator
MKQVRLALDDDLHHRLRVIAVASKRTLHEALTEGARLYVEAGERDLRKIALLMHSADALEEAERREEAYAGIEQQ